VKYRNYLIDQAPGEKEDKSYTVTYVLWEIKKPPFR